MPGRVPSLRAIVPSARPPDHLVIAMALAVGLGLRSDGGSTVFAARASTVYRREAGLPVEEVEVFRLYDVKPRPEDVLLQCQ